MKHTLIIMVGCPGSGKNYWIDNHKYNLNGSVKIVSRDEIRFSMLSEDDSYFAKEKEVYKKYVNEICDGVKNYDITIANATHLNEGSRSKLFRSIAGVAHPQNTEIIAMVIKNDLNTCLKQNAYRKDREFVPEDSIRNMYSSLTIPAIEEGFDKIYIYKGKENNKSKYEVIKKG